jgi:hypothetical protein
MLEIKFVEYKRNILLSCIPTIWLKIMYNLVFGITNSEKEINPSIILN